MGQTGMDETRKLKWILGRMHINVWSRFNWLKTGSNGSLL
jgi:hypothetical protein